MAYGFTDGLKGQAIPFLWRNTGRIKNGDREEHTDDVDLLSVILKWVLLKAIQ